MNFAVAIACALISAVCLAWGAERQGGAVRSDHGHDGLQAKGMLALIRKPRWLFGLLLMGLGTVFNVIALALAPITIVQPIGALALVLTTLLNARATKSPLTGALKASVAACLIGSAGFVLLGVKVRNENMSITAQQTQIILIITGIAIVVLGGLSLLRRVRIPAFAWVLGTGILYGMVAVQIKILATSFMLIQTRSASSVWEWARTQVPWLVAVGIVVAAILGGWFVQKAYASGPPDLVIAGLTVIDPLVGVVVGISVLHELRPDVPPEVAVGMGLSALIAMVGVLSLARCHPDAAHAPARPDVLTQNDPQTEHDALTH